MLKFVIIIVIAIIATTTTTTMTTVAHTNLESIENRIINGIEIDIENYPYIISVRRMGNHICGGAIISANWTITAAHCVIKTPAFQVTIRGGSSSRLTGVTYDVDQISMHPNFNGLSLNNDVAVLRVASEIIFTATMQPILLGVQGTIVPNGTVTQIAGWGLTALQGEPSIYLNAANVTVVDKDECDWVLAEFGGVTENDMCAGTGGADKCLGDLGGPLVHGIRLVGISSWFTSCGSSEWPGVYTHIASISIRSFIRQITGI